MNLHAVAPREWCDFSTSWLPGVAWSRAGVAPTPSQVQALQETGLTTLE
jgi:hypothetical protein